MAYAITPSERPREIRLYIEYFTAQYSRYPSLEEIAAYLCVKNVMIVRRELALMERNGFRWSEHNKAAA